MLCMTLWKVELTSNNQNFELERRNRTRNLPRKLPIASTIHNWSYSFNAHSKKV